MFTKNQVIRYSSKLDNIEHWVQPSYCRWKLQIIDHKSYLLLNYIRSKTLVEQFSEEMCSLNVYRVKIYSVTRLKDYGWNLLAVVVEFYIFLRLVDS